MLLSCVVRERRAIGFAMLICDAFFEASGCFPSTFF